MFKALYYILKELWPTVWRRKAMLRRVHMDYMNPKYKMSERAYRLGVLLVNLGAAIFITFWVFIILLIFGLFFLL